ncbi:MAG: ATP-binding protein [Chloroflexi bacterium]|nr:ATP-binding protein [Chloroflexota bacterium]
MVAEPVPITDELANAPQDDPNAPPLVPQPATIEETGLGLSMLADLLLKTIHFAGRPSGRQLARQLAISFAVTDELISFLRQNQDIEVVGTTGVAEQGYQYALTEKGQRRANDALERNQYVGPAPVPFELYTDVLERQSVSNIHIDRKTFLQGLSHLVLSDGVLAALGPAVNSGHSLLIYGGAGNGKTTITMAIGKILPGAVLIPYAVEIHGQIIRVFDTRVHEEIEVQIDPDRRKEGIIPFPKGQDRRRDARWVIAKRPVVSVGGELTLEDLELRYSPVSKFYIAPLQWKANSGMLIIDDFGRQMIQPQELLNRWIVPMEQGIDHLTLNTGDMVEAPFDTLLVFSSNIPPGRLGDEAFFRRIRHKVETPNPTIPEYLEILSRICALKGIPYSEEGAQYLVQSQYQDGGREPKACHPRDVVDLVIDIARFHGAEPTLEPQWIDLACASYFVNVDETS